MWRFPRMDWVQVSAVAARGIDLNQWRPAGGTREEGVHAVPAAVCDNVRRRNRT